jgi:hypothetical protein
MNDDYLVANLSNDMFSLVSQPGQYCEENSPTNSEVLTLSACKQRCRDNPACTAIHFYPEDQIERGDVHLSACFLSLGPCNPIPSLYRATIYFRPRLDDYPKECICPGESFRGVSIDHTLLSSRVMPGSLYVPSFQIVNGEAVVGQDQQQMLLLKFVPSRQISIVFGIFGMELEEESPPLVLLSPPSPLSFVPSETASVNQQDLCVCGSHAGIIMGDLLGNGDSETQTRMDSCVVPDGTGPISDTHPQPLRLPLQTLVEMQAVSCLCTRGTSVSAEHPTNPSTYTCIGCCRPLCYHEHEPFTGCPAGKYLLSVVTALRNETVCYRYVYVKFYLAPCTPAFFPGLSLSSKDMMA